MRRLMLLMLFCFTSLACNRGGDVEQARQSAESWIATLRLVKAQYADHRITGKYLQQTIDAARKAMDQIKPEARQQIQGTIDQLNQEISRKDAPTTGQT